jgi:hypothetical protein
VAVEEVFHHQEVELLLAGRLFGAAHAPPPGRVLHVHLEQPQDLRQARGVAFLQRRRDVPGPHAQAIKAVRVRVLVLVLVLAAAQAGAQLGTGDKVDLSNHPRLPKPTPSCHFPQHPTNQRSRETRRPSLSPI